MLQREGRREEEGGSRKVIIFCGLDNLFSCAWTGVGRGSYDLQDCSGSPARLTSCDPNTLRPCRCKIPDTVQGVVALDFHPTVSVLASGSRDCMVKFFDYSKPSAKRSYCSIPEVATARCLVFYPSGEYMLVGTEQSTRMYQTSVS